MTIKPTYKQELFITSDVKEIFYGGSRGGGKTFACLLDFASHSVEYGKHARGIFFRKTNKELEEAIAISKMIFSGLAVWRSGEKIWKFKNGATLAMRFMDREADVERYQGFSFSWIAFDELGNWATDLPYLFMFSSLRSPAGIPTYMRATGNPGGVGAFWLKARFITPLKPYAVHRIGKQTRQFIPATLEDNPMLMATDYEEDLKNLPEHLYEAFRYGNWDVFAGQVFSEWNPAIHVVEPFPIPPTWYKFASLDWGFAKPYSVGFWAVSDEGRLFRFQELYGASAPNVGTRESIVEVARKAADMAMFVGIEDMVADPACWIKQGFSEESVESVFSRHFIMHKGRNDRVTGWYALHNYLTTKMADGLPMMQVFQGCSDTIRTLPMMTVSKTNPEDIDTRTEDHACFVGSTLVETDKGFFPIEELVGTTGKVMTVFGYREYQNCRMTRKKARTIKMTFDNNSTITCTPDHKFMLWDGSWCEAIYLRGKILYNREWNITNTESNNGTKRFGKMSMVPFQRAISSITKTTMKGMMFLRTLFSWMRQSTVSIMRVIKQRNTFSSSKRQDRRRQESGMVVKKDINTIWNNTKSIAKRLSKESSVRYASSVEKSMKEPAKESSAQINVNRSGEGKAESMLLREYVTPVGQSLQSTNIIGPQHAPKNVQEKRLVKLEEAGEHDVYCLTVPSLGSFIVNEKVVSNCDEIRYSCLFIKNRTAPGPTWGEKNDSYSLLRKNIGGSGKRRRF